MRLRILNFNIIFSEFISGIHNLPTKHFWHYARDDNLVKVMLRNANNRQQPPKQQIKENKSSNLILIPIPSHAPPSH
jgi:hypothetical protein